MGVTVSIPAAGGYGADEALGSKRPAHDVALAAYHLAHSFPGGIAALALRMAVSPNTLTHKVNPNTATHRLTLSEAVDMQVTSGSAAILHAMASALGYVVHRATPDHAGGNPTEALVRASVDWADLVRAAGEPIARMAVDPAARPTGNELRKVEYHAQEVHASTGHMIATLRGCRPQAPGGVAC